MRSLWFLQLLVGPGSLEHLSDQEVTCHSARGSIRVGEEGREKARTGQVKRDAGEASFRRFQNLSQYLERNGTENVSLHYCLLSTLEH